MCYILKFSCLSFIYWFYFVCLVSFDSNSKFVFSYPLIETWCLTPPTLLSLLAPVKTRYNVALRKQIKIPWEIVRKLLHGSIYFGFNNMSNKIPWAWNLRQFKCMKLGFTGAWFLRQRNSMTLDVPKGWSTLEFKSIKLIRHET